MLEDYKDLILLVLAVLSFFKVVDLCNKWLKNHFSVRFECDIVPSLEFFETEEPKILYVVPERGWPVDDKIVNRLRIKAVNNGDARILIQSGAALFSGGESQLQYHDTFRSDVQVHLEPLEPPKVWNVPVKLENVRNLKQVYLMDSTGKKRKVSSKVLKELRTKAQDIIGECKNREVEAHRLGDMNVVIHQVEN
jgi:hypothetical protein